MEMETARTLVCEDLSGMEVIAQEILDFAGEKHVITLSGELGAGKTTLVQLFCKILEVEDHVTSPSFTILNEYRDKKGEDVYHFDFYRIKTASELFDLGFEVYFYSGNYCFIEWPEKISGLLPPGHVAVNISVESDKRIIKITL